MTRLLCLRLAGGKAEWTARVEAVATASARTTILRWRVWAARCELASDMLRISTRSEGHPRVRRRAPVDHLSTYEKIFAVEEQPGQSSAQGRAIGPLHRFCLQFGRNLP